MNWSCSLFGNKFVCWITNSSINRDLDKLSPNHKKAPIKGLKVLPDYSCFVSSGETDIYKPSNCVVTSFKGFTSIRFLDFRVSSLRNRRARFMVASSFFRLASNSSLVTAGIMPLHFPVECLYYRNDLILYIR
jgi:hypothetical protein